MARRSKQTSAIRVRLLWDAMSADREIVASSKRIQQFASDVSTTMLAAGAGGAAGLALLGREAVNYEKTVTGLARVTDTNRAQSMALAASIGDLRDEYAALAPLGREQLIQIAEIGARSGVATQDLKGFTAGVAALAVASGEMPEGLADGIVAFQNATGGAKDDASQLASAIAELGNTAGTSEGPIIRAAGFLAGLSTTAGLTRAEVLALAATVGETLPNRIEGGGNALNRTVQALNAAVQSGGAELEQFAAIADVSAEEFAAAWARSPVEALQLFLRGVSILGDEAVPALEQVGITSIEQAAALATLSGNWEGLGRNVQNASAAYMEGNAALDEAGIAAETAAGMLATLRNDLGDLGVEIGMDLLPSLKEMISVVSEMVDGFASLPDPVRRGLLVAGALVTVFNLVGGSALRSRAALAQMQAQLISLSATMGATQASATGLSGALTAAGRFLGPLGLVLAAGATAWGVYRAATSDANDELERTAYVASTAAQRAQEALDLISGASPTFDVTSLSADMAATEAEIESLERLVTDLRSQLGEQFQMGDLAGAEDTQITLDVFTGQLADARANYDELVEAARAFRTVLDESTDLRALEQLLQTLDPLSPEFRLLESRIEELVLTQLDQEEAQARVNARLAEARGATSALVGDVESLGDAYDALAGAQIDSVQANDAVLRAGNRLVDMWADGETSLEGASQAALANRAALIDYAEAALRAGEAEAARTGSVEAGVAVTQAWIGQLLTAAEAAGVNSGEIYGLLEALGLLPEQITTVINTEADLTGVNAATAALNGLPVGYDIPVTITWEPVNVPDFLRDQIAASRVSARTGGAIFTGTRIGGYGGGGGSSGGVVDEVDKARQEFFDAVELLRRRLDLELIDLTEYITELERLAEPYDMLSDEGYAAAQAIRDANQQIVDAIADQQEAIDDVLARADDALRDRAEEMQRMLDDTVGQLRAAGFEIADLISDMGGRDMVPDEDALTDYLDHRIEAIERTQQALSRLAERGATDQLVNQLAQGGVSNLGLIEALAGAGDLGSILGRLGAAQAAASGFANQFAPGILNGPLGDLAGLPLFGSGEFAQTGRVVQIGPPQLTVTIPTDVLIGDRGQLEERVTEIVEPILNQSFRQLTDALTGA